MKETYLFTAGNDESQTRNFIMFWKESLLRECNSLLIPVSGEPEQAYPLEHLKQYLAEHPWTVVYRQLITLEDDEELTSYIRSEGIPVIENDGDFDAYLYWYYTNHPEEKWNDGM